MIFKTCSLNTKIFNLRIVLATMKLSGRESSIMIAYLKKTTVFLIFTDMFRWDSHLYQLQEQEKMLNL